MNEKEIIIAFTILWKLLKENEVQSFQKRQQTCTSTTNFSKIKSLFNIQFHNFYFS